MKAAILIEQNMPLLVRDVEIPRLDVGQVLVKVRYSGICGSQLDEISGKQGEDPFLPHLLGHEGSGAVIDIGPGVLKVKEGDHVVLHWMKGSGIDSPPPKFKWNDTVVNAGCVTTFNEYAVVSENRVTPIPSDVNLDVACLLGCAVTTGLGIVFNNASLKPGQSIAIFGVGGVGLNVVQGAVLVNAYPIVAIDLHERKLVRAAILGATHRVDATRDKFQTFLEDLVGTRKFDVVVDTTGDRGVREMAYEITGDRGKTILAGVPHHQERITIDSFPLHFGHRIFGSHGGDTRPDTDIPCYIRLYKLGKLKLDEQITHRYSLDGVNEAIGMVRKGQTGKCVISMKS